MYGNRLGWMISAGMVIVMTGLLVMLAKADTISPPSAFARDPAVLAPLPPLEGMSEIVSMDEAGDAGPTYRKAIEAFKRNPKAYETFQTATKTDEKVVGPLREGVDAIKAGTRLSGMVLFAAEPASVINYDSERTDIPALQAVGMAAARWGLLIHKENPKEALALFEAVFSLGAKLFIERVTLDEARAGLGLMGASTTYIARLSEPTDKARAAAAKAFDERRKAYNADHLDAMARVLTSVDPGVMGRHAGDVFVIADRAAEPMWRVEAIRQLGKMRFAKMRDKRRGDELGALRAVRRYAQSTDNPAIAAAGKAAVGLTEPDFRMMR
jgi:hypothetical protein